MVPKVDESSAACSNAVALVGNCSKVDGSDATESNACASNAVGLSLAIESKVVCCCTTCGSMACGMDACCSVANCPVDSDIIDCVGNCFVVDCSDGTGPDAACASDDVVTVATCPKAVNVCDSNSVPDACASSPVSSVAKLDGSDTTTGSDSTDTDDTGSNDVGSGAGSSKVNGTDPTGLVDAAVVSVAMTWPDNVDGSDANRMDTSFDCSCSSLFTELEVEGRRNAVTVLGVRLSCRV